MERVHAEQVYKLVKEIFDRANQILYVVNNADDLATRKITQHALGVCITELDLEVLERIYMQFPDLRPPEAIEIT